MKKILHTLFLTGFILTLFSCSNVKLIDMDDSKRKSVVRENMKEYCKNLNETCRMNYFMAFNKEYTSNSPEHGAFANINIFELDTDSPMAETSFIISNSEKEYKEHSLGIINFIGIEFKITPIGDIVSHRYYASFYNTKTKHEEFVYFKDENELDISDLFVSN